MRILRYGLTKKELDSVEKNTCKLCDKPAKFVDHDHDSGTTRGFLCVGCNSALNRIEIPGWAEKALKYLEHYRNIRTITAKTSSETPST